MRWFTASVSFAVGLTTMWMASSPFTSSPTVPEHYFDLSTLPPELAAKFAVPDDLESLIKREAMRDEVIAARKAERAARPQVNLPPEIPEMPFQVKLYAPKAGSRWPEFQSPALRDALGEAKDEWVILNYWASWCAPCISELPDMDAAAPSLAISGVQLLTLNVNHIGDDTAEKIEKIFTNRAVDQLPQLRTEGPDIQEAIAAAGMSPTNIGLPHNIVFAPGGVPYAYFDGFPKVPEGTAVWSSDEMLAFFKALAASEP